MTTCVEIKLQLIRDINKSWVSEKEIPNKCKRGKKKKADKIGNEDEDTI